VNVDEVFRKLKPVMGDKLAVLWQEYILADPDTRQLIERTLRIMLARRYKEAFDSEQVLLEPPPEELAKGEYPLGLIHYGADKFYPFGLREAEFIQHIGIFGRSGSGKTNVAYLILLSFIRADKPFLVFDWKRNYRDLLSVPECKDLNIFTVGRDVCGFRFNPLIPPPGTPATVWLKKLIEIMCHAYFLGEGVAVLLLRAIDALYRESGMYEGKVERYPTIADIRDWLVAYKAKGREAGWMESTMRAVETLCFGEVGNVLNDEGSFDMQRLLDKRVILELDALTNSDKTFLIESLLLWIHHFRMGQSDRERFKHAVFIEEAHHILLRKKQEVTGEETVTDVLLREIRELGESIIVLDQHPSLISKPALGNTYATIAMNLKHRGDIAMIKDCLLMDSEQAGYLGKLEIGWAVAKLQGRWFKPFLVKFPLVTLDKGSVTDDTIRRHMDSIENGRRRLRRAREGFSEVISQKEGFSGRSSPSRGSFRAIPGSAKREEKGKKCAIILTTKESDFLKDVLQHTTSPITERYRRLGLSPRVGNSLHKSLLDNNLISSESISSGKGRIKSLCLTRKGREVLGYDVATGTRHGGMEHQYWKEKVSATLRERGYTVEQEYPIGDGKTVDLVARKNGKTIAIEVETGKSDALANIRKCVDVGFDKVITVATNTQVKSGIRRQVQQLGEPVPRVTIVTADEFMNGPPSVFAA